MMVDDMERQEEITEIDADTDVAAAMGFDSFGPKPHLNKKRKVESSHMPSGSNTLSLGTRSDHSHESYLQNSQLDSAASESAQGSSEVRGFARTSENRGSNAGDHANTSQVKNDESRSREKANRGVGGRLPNGEWDWQALRKGVRDENGDIAYYDASFVENPWASLNKKG